MAHPSLRVRPAGSFISGKLPVGCVMCEQGAKLVLFVTGVCHYKCFYCPISSEKRMNRSAWANERKIDADDLAAIADEARLMDAKGTGLTGGDPMYDPERTLRYIRFLKAEFGPKHHIHIYTQIPFDVKWLRDLEDAGLDEIRFHPPDEIWSDVDAHAPYAHLYREALRTTMTVGMEIPCIPGSHDQMESLIRWADAAGMKFINVNEMEFSETNYPQLLGRGYRIKDDVTSRAMDSEEVALEVIRRIHGVGNGDGNGAGNGSGNGDGNGGRKGNGTGNVGAHADAAADAPSGPAGRASIAIHFCSSPFKDRIQLRERLRRRAENVKRPYEEVTEDATLLRGVIECPEPQEMLDEIAEVFDVPRELLEVVDGKLHLHPDFLEEIAAEIPFPCYLSEVYPTADGLEVERVPLNGAPGLPDA